MAPYRPTLQVEVALGYGALNDSPSWTAVQTDGLEFTITRGRSTEFDQFQAATASVRLKDTDRRYDPLYSAGTYAGSLLPNVPIRITATDSGTVFPRFYGYVDSWDYDPRRNIGFTTVPATDGFKILAQKKLPQSVYETVVLARNPWLYWKLGETGTVAVDSSSNDRDGTYGVGADQAVASPRPFGAGGVDVNGAIPAVTRHESLNLPTTIELWLTGPASASGVIAEQRYGTVGTDRWRLSVQSTGTAIIAAKFEEASGVHQSRTEFAAPWIASDNPRHLAIVMTVGGDNVVYVNGQVVSTTTVAASVGVSFPGISVGSSIADGSASFDGTVSDLVIYSSALTASQVEENYVAAASPWYGDTTGERITRILDLIGWPAALRDIDAGEVILGNADLDGMNALAYLQLIAASEGGRLFMSADGKVTFHGAARLRANTTAEATFSDDGADNPYLYGSLRYSKSDRPIVNEASVQRKYGLPQTATDATSIASFGTKTKTLSGLLMQTDGQSRARAEQLVYRYKDAQTRVDSWTVNPQAKPAQWQQHLALELGDHVELEVKPANVGTRDTIQMDLEMITERATPSAYEFTFVGSPRDPNVLNYLTWGGTLSSQSWGTGVWA